MNTKEIRFIDPGYNELFRIQDGASIVVTRSNGEEYVSECKYLDETHFEANGTCYHICQFAEMMAHNGAVVKPETEPEVKVGYRIIQRNLAGDKVFKLGYNPNAVQKFVTWQSYRDNPARYDWGHYWSDKNTAKTDLFHRTNAECRGIPYDHTKLFKQPKTRNDAR